MRRKDADTMEKGRTEREAVGSGRKKEREKNSEEDVATAQMQNAR